MSYFNSEDGFYVGYHIEGCETFECSGLPELTMETLTDARVLYMCNNPKEWFADHLVDKIKQRILKIKFCKTEGIKYSYNVFMDIKPYTSNLIDGTEIDSFDPDGEEILKRTGMYLHYTLGEPRNELTEGFLIHPTKYVVSIEEVDLSTI